MIGAVISIFLHLGYPSPAIPSFCPDSTATAKDSVKASYIVYVKSAALPAATIDRKTIESLPASTIADAARYFAGVQIKDYGGIGGLKTINVRSLGSHHTGVFYNGIRIDNAQNGQVDLGRFSLDNVESITLYQAQKADLLQSASDLASAASVYIKTRKPQKTGAELSYKTGAFATRNPGIIASYHGKVTASADVSYLYTDGRYRFSFHEAGYDTTATRSNGDVKALKTELNLWYGKLSLNGFLYSSERGLPGPVVRRISDQYSSKDRQWDRSAFVQGGWETSLSESLSLKVGGKYAHDYCRYLQDPSKNAAVMKVDNRYWQNEAYFFVASAWRPLAWLGASLSLDGRRNGFSSSSKTLSAASIPEAERLTGLASAQIALSPGAGWHLHGSVLASYFKDRASGAWSSRTKWTPTVILSYEGLPWLKMRAFYKEIFRMPTFNDLYYTIGGRAALNPEYTRQIDLGADLSLPIQVLNGVFRFSADVYSASIRDKIVAIPAASQFRWSVINYGKVKAKGADVSLAASSRIDNMEIGIRTTYSYEDARDRTDRDSEWFGGRIAYSPEHCGSAVASIGYKGLNASVSWIYTGKRYRNSANIKENELKPWYTTDLALAWKGAVWQRASGSIGIEINNLWDQDYEVVTRYPMPGRHVLIKLKIDY